MPELCWFEMMCKYVMQSLVLFFFLITLCLSTLTHTASRVKPLHFLHSTVCRPLFCAGRDVQTLDLH
jgi:hypothetical protein